MIPGSEASWEVESVPYEQSTSQILFSDSEVLIPGLEVDACITRDISISLGGFWRSYDPKHVTPPDSASHPLDRSGSFSMYTLGFQKTFGKIFVGVGAEAHYFRESWSDPFHGGIETRDSLSLGPAVGAGTLVDLSYCSIKFDLGLVFPGFSDIWGRIGLTLLLL